MDPATISETISLIPKVIKLGKKIIEWYKAYLGADDELDSLVLSLTNQWFTAETQIQFIFDNKDTLPYELCYIQAKAVYKLQVKLKKANWTFRTAHSNSEPNPPYLNPKKLSRLDKVRYVFRRKSLKRIIQDIKDWQAEYNPTGYMINRVFERLESKGVAVGSPSDTPGCGSTGILVATSNKPEATKSNNLIVKPETLSSEQWEIPFTSLVTTFHLISNSVVLLDCLTFPAAAGEEVVLIDVHNLAQKLTNINPHLFGLLQCYGLFRNKPEPSTPQLDLHFSFIYTLPSGFHSPKSLRSHLIDQTVCPLNERIDLAKRLVNAVSFAHSAEVVHKNIRPETIIMLKGDESCLGVAFLAGFSMFRSVKGLSLQIGDDEPEKDLYRHPTRQGTHPEQYYKMHHDIYSLGVCLLEIGLWQSFVNYEGTDSIEPDGLTEYVDIAPGTFAIQDVRQRATKVKMALLEMAGLKLEAKMGKEYASIVVACLKCLDAKEGMGGDGEGEKESLVIGVNYIQEVVQRIHRLKV